MLGAPTTTGGLNYQNIPKICDKSHYDSIDKPLSHCLKYEKGNWELFFEFNFPRSDSAMSMSVSGEFFISGGVDHNGTEIRTSEVLTENGWKLVKSLLPVKIKLHCMAHLNLTTFILIGGQLNGSLDSSHTIYYYNTMEEVWSEGPHLIELRMYHVCGRIAKDKDSNEFTGITVGGIEFASGRFLRGVEVLDDGHWKPGPDFPVEITCAALVEIPNGGILIIGGELNWMERYDTIFRLDHGGKSAQWYALQQKLSHPNSMFTAFLIPDYLANCTEI